MDRGRAFKGKAERLEKVEALAIDRLGAEDGRDLVAFIRAFYDRVTSDDLLEISIDNLYGAALALWKFAATRKPGETSVRAYNPRIDEHGWHASHTVIEIINDDMPFLVDSVVGNLSRMGHVFHLLVHPVVRVARDEAGARQGLLASGEAGIAESVMHIQVGEQTGREALGAIEDRLAEVLADVRLSVEDWPGMMERLDDAIAELEAGVPVEAEESEEAGDFLRWMRSTHFTFLGCRDFAYAKKRGKETLEVVDGSGHGILRDPERQVLRGTDGSGLTPAGPAVLPAPGAVVDHQDQRARHRASRRPHGLYRRQALRQGRQGGGGSGVSSASSHRRPTAARPATSRSCVSASTG